jgi:hypothetical protein
MGLQLVADLSAGAFEMVIWPTHGPVEVRFSLD